jgi:NDP-sugar pyrophosphorylase family protein
MYPVLGTPFVEWVCRYVAKHGISSIQISTGYLADTVEAHFKNLAPQNYRVQCVEEATPLGTGGGFAFAANAIAARPHSWVVLNGDSLVFADLGSILSTFHQSGLDGAIVGIPMDDASRYGSLAVGPNNSLRGFSEKRLGPALINAGVYLLSDSLVRAIPANKPLSFETDLFPDWLNSGKQFAVYECDAPFLDIGTESSLPLAKSFISSNLEHFTIG